MIFNFEKDKNMLGNQYENDNWADGGMSAEEVEKECFRMEQSMSSKSKQYIKARIFSFVLNNAYIEINPFDLFCAKINHCAKNNSDIMQKLRAKWQKEVDTGAMHNILSENKDAMSCGAYLAAVDFSHTAPDWETVMHLGLVGLLDRLKSEREKCTDAQKIEFYESAIIVYEAIISYIKRLAREADRLSSKYEKSAVVSQCLSALTKRAPQSMIEAMWLTIILYYVQTFIETTNVRSLGIIDRLYYPFYKVDLESGRYTKAQLREIIDYFLYEFYAMKVGSNTPFCLCAQNSDKSAYINELSYIILEEYDKLSVPDPKIHIRYNNDLPQDFLSLAFNTIKHGNNSVVFINDDIVIKSLVKIGQSESDASEYIPIGCYEPASSGKEIPCTCAGKINLLKAVELALSGGNDMISGKKITDCKKNINSYEQFFSEVEKNISFFISQSMNVINNYEKHYMDINPSPMLSATFESCIKSGRDVYAGGAVYNNSSICVIGIASAADSLAVIKKMIFEEKQMSLEEFYDILKNDWKDNYLLRMRCRSMYPKYGNNNNAADETASYLTKLCADKINGKPNGRGGVYRCAFFSINWIGDFGKVCGASADGRRCGEVISKNTSPTIGCDKKGPTALISSAAKIDYTLSPNGAVLDLMLHSSAVSGHDGMKTAISLMQTYMMCGGFAMQFNIVSPDVLIKAQQNPLLYSNLQIRLCGWNVYFVDLSQREQNEFIKMAQNLAV